MRGQRVHVVALGATRRSSWQSFRRAAGSTLRASTAPGRRIVYADYKGGTIAVQDLQSGRTITAWRRAPSSSGTSGWPPTASTSRPATATGKLYIWSLDRPERPERVLSDTGAPSTRSCYGPNGRIVTAGIRSHRPCMESGNGNRGHPARTSRRGQRLRYLRRNGSQVLSASADGTLRLWDANSGAALAVLQSGGGPLWDVAVSRDGRIATLSSAGVIRVFNCEVCGSLDQVARSPARAQRGHFPRRSGNGSLPVRLSVYPEGNTPGSARREFRCLQKLCLPRSTSHASHWRT